jgi:DNA-directed RNA polymerase I, II, and III subunit RPABC2
MDTDYVESGGLDGGEDVADILEDFNEGVETDQAQQEASSDPALAYLYNQHPETVLEYVEAITPKLNDPKKSMPFLTNFERTKILGFRATQLSLGARPFISVPFHVTDIKEIARLELQERRLPYILKRPMPDGTFEYWRLVDLMVL